MKEGMLTREQGKIVYNVPPLQCMFVHVHRFEGSTGPLAVIHERVNENWTSVGLKWDESTAERV